MDLDSPINSRVSGFVNLRLFPKGSISANPLKIRFLADWQHVDYKPLVLASALFRCKLRGRALTIARCRRSVLQAREPGYSQETAYCGVFVHVSTKREMAARTNNLRAAELPFCWHRHQLAWPLS
jgi:hypothetical protein